MRLKKCFSFSKSKLCIPLAHHARFQAFPEKRHLFGAALCRFIFSECTKAETLSVLLPTCWLPYKGTESQARRTGRPHRAEASLFSRRPLSSSAPGEVDPHDTEFHQIHLAPAFWAHCATLEFINLNSGPISKLRLGEIREQKRELRWQSLQETTPKSFSKSTKEPKPERSLLELTLHNDLENPEILWSWSAYLFLNSVWVEEHCQIFQTPEVAQH